MKCFDKFETILPTNLISFDQFETFKSNMILINTARGGIINEDALYEALKNKKIAGAALDVFDREPLDSKNPLFNLNNVFLSPHISGNFSQYQTIMIKQFSDMLLKFVNNKTFNQSRIFWMQNLLCTYYLCDNSSSIYVTNKDNRAVY